MRFLAWVGATALVVPVIAAFAQGAPSSAQGTPPSPQGAQPSAETLFAQRLVNDPRAEALRPYGSPIAPEVRSDKTVQFGHALRVPVSSAGADFWRVGVVTPTLKPVQAGDRIVVAFWARTQRAPDKAPGRICRVQLESTPAVRTIFEQPFDLTPEWTMYKLTGKADRAYAPGGLNAAFHLACAKQTIDIFGAVFIMDYGQ